MFNQQFFYALNLTHNNFTFFRCDGADFHLTKSHKKILKNLNNFLQNGNKVNQSFGTQSVDVEKNVNVEQHSKDETNESSASEEIKMITSNPKVQIDIESALKLIEADSERNHLEVDMNNNNVETVPDASIRMELNDTNIEIKDSHKFNEGTQKSDTVVIHSGDVPKVGKTQQLKAKLLRQQRKAEKQMANASSTDIDQRLLTKKVPTNIEKTLKSLIDEMPNNGNHKLKVCVFNDVSQ